MATLKRMALLAPVGVWMLVRCASPPSGTCIDICHALERCEYLPSVLGAEDDATSDGEGNCESRCSLSANSVAYAEINDCFSSAGPDSDPDYCNNFGACLHGNFPLTPITGLSRVEVNGYVNADAMPPKAGCNDTSVPVSSTSASNDATVSGCFPNDAGQEVSFVRAFVDEWGTRQYSNTTSCQLPLVVVFENVPADKHVQMGFQITKGSTCQEYVATESVQAGCNAFSVAIDLANPTAPQCLSDKPVEAGAADAPSETAATGDAAHP